MSETSALIFGLIALNAAQGLFFLYQIQKLINKIMSRDYYDYKQDKVKKERTTSKEIETSFDTLPPPPDLGF